MNTVNLIGRLTKDVELRYLPTTGTPVATFSMAIDRDYKKQDGSRDTDFIPVEVMGKPADFCANYLGKGRLVAIEGSVRVDRYVTEAGENRTFTKVSAKKVKALDKKKDDASVEPAPEGFQVVNDDEIPF